MADDSVVRTRVEDLGSHVGQQVELRGWLYNKRSSGKLLFLQIRDGSGIVQGVVYRPDAPGLFALGDRLGQESSLVVRGAVKADPRAPGGYELSLTDLRVLQETQEYPIAPKEHGVEFLMDHRHLWLRSRRQHAILRVRAEVIRATRSFLDETGFVLVDAPILTPLSVEGTTTLFETDYFDEKAYLTQSGQLYAEAAAMAFGRVYTFGPTFRAEKSKTRRHLMEFWMVEPEAAFMEHQENMALQERLVSAVVAQVLERRRPELEVLERDTAALERVKPPFPRLTYDEAVAILKERPEGFEWGEDFGAPEETELASRFDRPVFIERYPQRCKAFYMQPDPERPDVVLCDDLLAPEGYGEIIGGGQRIHDPVLMEERLRAAGLPLDRYGWYLDLRRYGSVPHAGFGMGIERVVAWVCGLPHVRETIPFPRMLNRLTP
ncbi:asparagine--tRNA ligase [Limnochorda pilosa]|uniref:Asparagine--tRNA ligase n=1 Tax=Limnochorda pilosa TaxID=1555112 RepID=A0A0K2SFK8_LIMPI|nr:asparagine--tRNA ligase [Limnochorda pilosa]BAS25870.1 asparaginyl-tRNA synthetase [Limnochorda pilosa]